MLHQDDIWYINYQYAGFHVYALNMSILRQDPWCEKLSFTARSKQLQVITDLFSGLTLKMVLALIPPMNHCLLQTVEDYTLLEVC